MRNWKRFSIRSMLILMVLVSGVLWLFLPLIRGDAYAEFTVLDVAITPKNEIQIVVDSKKTRNCTIGLSAPSSPIVGATQEPWFVFPGWPENRQVFYIGSLANGVPDANHISLIEGQEIRLDSRNPELLVYTNAGEELKLSFKRH